MLETATSALPGFDSPVHDSQQVFRAALDAFAHPGRIVEVVNPGEVPAPLNTASAGLCLALVDFETPLWLDERARNSQAAIAYLRFHCGCTIVDDPANAAFALIADPGSLPALTSFRLGSDPHPEDAATVIIQVPELRTDRGVRLSGPGIERTHLLSVDGLDGEFWSERIRLGELFPRGIDLVFAESSRIAAVPRSTRLEV